MLPTDSGAGLPPPAGRVTPPRCGLFLLRRSHMLTGVLNAAYNHAVYYSGNQQEIKQAYLLGVLFHISR